MSVSPSLFSPFIKETIISMTKIGTILEKSLYEHRLDYLFLYILTYINFPTTPVFHSIVSGDNKIFSVKNDEF